MTPHPPGLAPQDVHKQLEDMRQQLMAFHYMFQSGLDHKAETVSQALEQDVPTPSDLRPLEGFLTVEKQQPRPISHSSRVQCTKCKAEKVIECDIPPSRGDSLYRVQQARGHVWDVARRRYPRCYYSPAPSHHRRTTPETRRALWREDGRDQSSDEDQDDQWHRELYRYCSPGQGEHCTHRELLSGLPVLHQEVLHHRGTVIAMTTGNWTQDSPGWWLSRSRSHGTCTRHADFPRPRSRWSSSYS